MVFEELKQRQSAMWGNGRFELVSDTIADVHEAVVDALGPADGKRWLDLACGTGGVAELAVRAGATVTGTDLAPALIETAKRLAAEEGLEIDYRVGDCEQLGFLDDGSFDIASSTFGFMFAPDHRAAATELARVVRPGGRIGLANWTPGGGVGRMFTMTAGFQPPPPAGAGVPLDWGRRDHVKAMLGSDFDLTIEERTSTLSLGSAEEYWQLFSTNFGPVKTLAESLDDDRREEFHQGWIGFFETNYASSGSIVHTREYLLVTGTRK